MAATITEVHVSRADLHKTEVAQKPVTLAPGQALFAVEQFALTANNITYAAHGEDMGYWRFYPAPEGWGIVPVWGFARVEQSTVEGLAAGERVYGYWPMASHAVLEPIGVSPRGFADGAAHRQGLATIYNGYQRVSGTGFGDERAYALFRPLYTTSFLIDAWIGEEVADADAAILSSASSKTALGLAQALKSRGTGRPRVIGLTSAANRAFVEATGYYDQVTTYDEVNTLTAERPLFVDFAGSDAVRVSVHQKFGDRLAASMVIGDTHWDSTPAAAPLPGPRPALFFAPTEAVKRMEAWGQAGFAARLDAKWQSFMESTKPWLRIVEGRGAASALDHYHAILEGKAAADEGVVLSL